MNERVCVAEPRLLMHYVNGLSVQIEGQHLGEGDAGTVHAELRKTGSKWRRRAHEVPSETVQRVFLHGDKSAALAPSRISVGVSQVLRSDHHIAKRASAVFRENFGDGCCACG